jgi:hypothetical protein
MALPYALESLDSSSTAARIGHQAATSIPEDDENKLLALFNLLEILGERYKITNTTGALEQLLQIRRQVYERLPLDHPDRPAIGRCRGKDSYWPRRCAATG